MNSLNIYFDHTLLKPDAKKSDIIKLCEEAKKYSFYSVCVNSCNTGLAASFLKDSSVKVTSVVGFPLGAMASDAKAYEADATCAAGADEIDMVINIGALKDGDTEYVTDDIAAVSSICTDNDAVLKVIIETCLLTDDEIVSACRAAERAGADFVKTSTGFASPPEGKTSGATVRDVKLMRSAVSDNIKIKASGGIHSLAQAHSLIEAGADRLGASASVNIMEEYLRYLT